MIRASWTSKLLQVWKRGIWKVIILPWSIFIFMFLQYKECFIKCAFYITYCLLCLRRSCCFKDGPLSNWFKWVFYVHTFLLPLSSCFHQVLTEQISYILFIQGLNLYPLKIMATTQNVAYLNEVWYLSTEVILCLHVKDWREKNP